MWVFDWCLSVTKQHHHIYKAHTGTASRKKSLIFGPDIDFAYYCKRKAAKKLFVKIFID
jgi:hypothetical protein